MNLDVIQKAPQEEPAKSEIVKGVNPFFRNGRPAPGFKMSQKALLNAIKDAS